MRNTELHAEADRTSDEEDNQRYDEFDGVLTTQKNTKMEKLQMH
jgi:hypothetical protein